ncbi:MAG TPA: tetratricopeptide repeat protein, partial [Bryobacteraceae bacterium]|nr:tetratricopeptide repeat protein [Bryobacteraceae bacterium]
VVLGLAGWAYFNYAASKRQAELAEAMQVYNGTVGDANSPYVKSFKTAADKDKAVVKTLSDLANKYSGNDEGIIARYYLGVTYADQAKFADAEREWKEVIAKGNKNLASQAKLSLAQLYAATGKPAEAETLLRDLMNHPTILVSKEQAQVELGRTLAKTNPAEARKLLEPLRTERSAVSRMALSALSEIR